MNLSDFIKEQKQLLNNFESYWQTMMEEDAEAFPSDMDAEEWDEHLAIFNINSYRSDLEEDEGYLHDD